MEKRRVVITGLGTVNPLGTSVSASWDAAKAGKCGIGPITQFDTTDFKCKLAGEVKDFDPETVVDKKEARKMARFTLLALADVQIGRDDEVTMLDEEVLPLLIPYVQQELEAPVYGISLGDLVWDNMPFH